MQPKMEDYTEQLRFWCLMYLALAFAFGLSTLCQKMSFSTASENLIFRIRMMLFEGIIFKDISWFDSKDTAPGVLSNVLAEDISLLNGLTTEAIATIMQGIFGLIVGLVLAFFFSWRVALITLGVSPFMMVGGMIRGKMVKKEHGGNSDSS